MTTKLSQGGPTLTLVVAALPTQGNFVYEIYLSTDDGALDQRLSVRNAVPLNANRVRLADVTADGYLDLLVVGGPDHRGEDWYKTWLYDQHSGKFRWINDPQ